MKIWDLLLHYYTEMFYVILYGAMFTVYTVNNNSTFGVTERTYITVSTEGQHFSLDDCLLTMNDGGLC